MIIFEEDLIGRMSYPLQNYTRISCGVNGKQC